MNRKDRRGPEGRKLLNMMGREIALQGTAEDQLAAEEQLAAAAENPQSSYATTMSVLAHTWFTLDQAREAARVTYIRAIKLREQGREMSTTMAVKQYSEAQAEIEIVEEQIVELLCSIVEDPGEGLEPAFGLLGAAHTNVQSGISVRLPHGAQVRLALESGILAPEDSSESAESNESGESRESEMTGEAKPPPGTPKPGLKGL